MKPSEAKNVIELMLELKIPTPLGLVGHRGTGKSQVVKDIAQEKNIPLVILRLGSCQDVGDLIGLPEIVEEDGRKITKYGTPWWYDELTKPSNNGRILFIDEINRCKPTLAHAVMQILDERRFLTYKLPEDTVIVCSMNPSLTKSNIEYDVIELDAAAIDRVVWVSFTVNKEDVLSYLIEKDFHPTTIDIVSLMNELEVNEPFELPRKCLTGRGIRQLNEMMELILRVPESVALELVVGCIGPQGALLYKNMERLRRVPKPEDYFEGKVNLEQIEKLEPIEQLTFINRLISYIKTKIPTREFREKFTKAMFISEPIALYVLRVANETPTIDKFIDYFSEEANRKISELCKLRDLLRR